MTMRTIVMFLALLGACAKAPPPPAALERPNILLVVADDLGFSDTGPYGSEIRTPTLDALAQTGLIATNFYVSPRGAPTRAMLLTGVDHHLAGFGGLRGQRPGTPGYEGHLTGRVVTVATLLREAGYHTYMAGKWELGEAPEQRPAAHGFDHSFALLEDVASHWADMKTMREGRERADYSHDGELLEALPADHFSTRSFTDFLIESIDANRDDGAPFFAYLAYQAPHSPLAVPDDWRDRSAGRYAAGFQAIAERRLTALKRRGLVHKDVVPFPGLPTIPAWADLSDESQKQLALRMELYATMVENLDFHLGRLLDHLEAIGERRDTLVIFLSDNGASASNRGPVGTQSEHREWLAQAFPASGFENWGRPGSFVEYGPGWAQVSSVPFRMFKGTFAEGGIRSPLVVSGPGVFQRGEATGALLHVTDLVPTLLEATGASYPDYHQGRRLEPLTGRSLLPLFAGSESEVRGDEEWLGFELGGDRAIRRGRWKAIWMKPPLGPGAWRLYRLDQDPAELYDRSKGRPAELRGLVDLWESYARSHDVVVEPDEPISAAR